MSYRLSLSQPEVESLQFPASKPGVLDTHCYIFIGDGKDSDRHIIDKNDPHLLLLNTVVVGKDCSCVYLNVCM